MPSPDPYYGRHIFFCVNTRADGSQSCGLHPARSGYDRCKARVKAAGLSGPGLCRVNTSSCLNRCDGAPVAVVYPEGTWYTFVDDADIDEIVDSHLRDGRIVERLVLPAGTGRGEAA